MFEIFQLIQTIRDISRGSNHFLSETKAFLNESDRLIEDQDDVVAETLRRTCRRIVLLAFLFPACGAYIMVVSPIVAFHIGHYPGKSPALAVILAVVFALPFAIYFFFAGVALGCSLAPSVFWDSPVGQKYFKLIGTNNRVVAKIVCFVHAVSGLVITIGMAVFLVSFLEVPAADVKPRR